MTDAAAVITWINGPVIRARGSSQIAMGDMVGAFHNANIGGTISAAFLDGTQVTPTVECFVNNCRFWHSNNLCNAHHIEVDGVNAAKTTDTDCKTFKEH